MIHYQVKAKEDHYKPEQQEQWAYDGNFFVGKLYYTETEYPKACWIFDPRLGSLPSQYGSSKLTFFSEEHVKSFIENPHLVENEFVGFNNRQRLTCLSCGVTLLQQPFMTDWKERVKQFLNAHPSHLRISED